MKRNLLALALVIVMLVAAMPAAIPAAAQGGDDGRVNPFGGLGAPVAIYYEDGNITLYVITPESLGEFHLYISAEEIEAAGIPAEGEPAIILSESVNPYGGFDIIVSRLDTGEFRLYTRKDAAFNPPDDTEPYIVQWMTNRSDAYTLKE